MQLTLIRHGETVWNALQKVQGQIDIQLNEEGIAQALQLAQKIDEIINQYAVIYCSKLQRAFQTANIIRGNHSHIPIIEDRRLNSRDLGDFSGRTLEEIKAEDPIIFEKWRGGDPSFRPPNGESTKEMLSRTQDFIRNLKTEYKSTSKIFIVSHRENIGAFFRILNIHQAGSDPLHKIENCTPYDCFI
jgi:probable phosphoglycerate mutase